MKGTFSPCPYLLDPLLSLLRLKSLQGHLAAKHMQLQATVELYQFDYVSSLELAWVAEHMPSASATSGAQCWASTQSLQYKHKVWLSFYPRILDVPFPDFQTFCYCSRSANL